MQVTQAPLLFLLNIQICNCLSQGLIKKRHLLFFVYWQVIYVPGGTLTHDLTRHQCLARRGLILELESLFHEKSRILMVS
jgi:hypothetical protein